MYSMLGEMEIAREGAALAGERFEVRRASSARLTLPDEPRNCSGGRFRGTQRGDRWAREIFRSEMRVDAGGDYVGRDFFAGFQRYSGCAAVFNDNFVYGGLVRISTPSSRAAAAMALLIAPVPPRLKPQERKAPSILPCSDGGERRRCRESGFREMYR